MGELCSIHLDLILANLEDLEFHAKTWENYCSLRSLKIFIKYWKKLKIIAKYKEQLYTLFSARN
jgi:hypothetical protein